MWKGTRRKRNRRSEDKKKMQGVRTTVERIKDSLAHFDTMKMEITCFFSCNVSISGHDIFWLAMCY